MRTQTITSFDLTVFETIFDPHKRGKQCLRLIHNIQENKPDPLNQKQFNKKPVRARVLFEANKDALLEYIGFLITRIKRQELSFASFEKYLNEAWCYCLWLENKEARTTTKQDIEQ